MDRNRVPAIVVAFRQRVLATRASDISNEKYFFIAFSASLSIIAIVASHWCVLL
jgi:hypothetical protein